MANIMQVITFMSLIYMKIPEHTSELLEMIRKVVTFDQSVIFDLYGEDALDDTLELVYPEIIEKDVAISPKFKLEDMDTQYSLKALIVNIITLIFFLIVKTYNYLMYKLNLACLRKKRQAYKISYQQTSSQLMLVLVETCLDISIACSIELIVKDTSAKETVFAYISYYFSMLLLILTVLWVIFAWQLLLKNKIKINYPGWYPEFHRRYDSIWSEQRLNLNGFFPVFQIPFVLRRLAYGIILTTF